MAETSLTAQEFEEQDETGQWRALNAGADYLVRCTIPSCRGSSREADR